ncbi:MAG: site-specific integrase [Methanomicrobium sp.]|nr:site-specific integrase [Methanomicrobium sp.]
MSLKSLVAAYIAFQRAHVTPQTVVGDQNALKAVLRILGEDTDVSTIDARYVSGKLDASGEPNTTKNYRLKHIKKLFRWAYSFDYIPADWTGKLKKYKDDEKARREFKYLEPDELRAVLSEMKIEKYKVLTEFLALSGLRVGEALALKKDDFDGRTLHVRRTLSLVTYEIGEPKTSESRRDIHIQTELLPVLGRIPDDCFAGIRYPAYNKYLKETTLRVLGRALSPHSLRHTHVSLLAAAGVPLEVISHRCGHSYYDVTREIYLHVTQKMKDRDAAILDSIRLL